MILWLVKVWVFVQIDTGNTLGVTKALFISLMFTRKELIQFSAYNIYDSKLKLKLKMKLTSIRWKIIDPKIYNNLQTMPEMHWLKWDKLLVAFRFSYVLWYWCIQFALSLELRQRVAQTSYSFTTIDKIRKKRCSIC